MSKHQALIDAPSLHDEIMNLPCVQVNMEPRGSMARLAYKVGHRDARHAAAELAQVQDATIRALQADRKLGMEIIEGVFKGDRDADGRIVLHGWQVAAIDAALDQMAGG